MVGNPFEKKQKRKENNMKKTICMLLTLVMLLALTACGSPAKPASPDTAAPKAAESAPAAETAPAEEAAPVEEAVEAEDILGEKTETSYASKFLGIQATFPDNWTVLDDEQTAQVMGYVADVIDSEDLAELLRESGSACDLYAMAVDQSGDNLNIQLEDLGTLYGIVLSEEKYLEIAAPQLEDAMGQMGMENVQLEKGTYSFAGQDHVSVRLTATYSGVPIVERLVLLKAGNYMGVVTAFSLDESRVDAVLACFEPYSA